MAQKKSKTYKQRKKYTKKREGCTSSTIIICGVSLSLFANIQAAQKIATGRTLSMQQTFNYIMNDYNNLRNQVK